jgi:long-chain fatty acid transport protein
VALDLVAATGIELTERLSLGGSLIVGSSFLDGPFVDTGGMALDYALRGSLGLNYQVTPATWFGTYWQTQKPFTFDDAALLGGLPAQDIRFVHPDNFGWGIANRSLLDGRLLIAADIIFKVYSNAAFLKEIYDDQLGYQFGTQFDVSERLALRLGYVYADNPMRGAQTTSIGGVPIPDGIPGLRYIQGQFAAITQHWLTGGIGMRDVLPGIDMNVFGGGGFRNTDQFGSTQASLAAYWLGFGLTWRFGRGADGALGIPNQW